MSHRKWCNESSFFGGGSQIFTIALLTLCSACEPSSAGVVRQISWNTENASPPAKFDENQKNLLPLIRFGVSALPEPQVMQLSFFGGSALGLPEDKAQSLHALLAKRYELIGSDEVFSKVPSALSYCFSATKPETGFATVYVPEGATLATKVILFLHGYGGSFMFYQHYFGSAFPDHIVICPAFGISCANVPSEYIQESLDATSKELGFRLRLPVLMGLSAGGFGGFREYTKRPASYAGYICLAAYPPDDVVSLSPQSGRIRIVAGGKEPFVESGVFRNGVQNLKKRTANCSSQLIPDQDHFFMLGAEDTTKKLLKTWNAELQNIQ